MFRHEITDLDFDRQIEVRDFIILPDCLQPLTVVQNLGQFRSAPQVLGCFLRLFNCHFQELEGKGV